MPTRSSSIAYHGSGVVTNGTRLMQIAGKCDIQMHGFAGRPELRADSTIIYFKGPSTQPEAIGAGTRPGEEISKSIWSTVST